VPVWLPDGSASKRPDGHSLLEGLLAAVTGFDRVLAPICRAGVTAAAAAAAAARARHISDAVKGASCSHALCSAPDSADPLTTVVRCLCLLLCRCSCVRCSSVDAITACSVQCS
jgi:hypothetical protein